MYCHLSPQQGGSGMCSRKAEGQIACYVCAMLTTASTLPGCYLLCMVSWRKRVRIYFFKSEAGLSHCRFRSTWKHVHYTTPGSRKPKRLRYLLLLGTLGNCTMQQSTCTSLSEKNLMILLEQLTPHSCFQIQQHDPSIL